MTAASSFPTGRFGDVPNPRYIPAVKNGLEISNLGDGKYYLEFSTDNGRATCEFKADAILVDGRLNATADGCKTTATFDPRKSMISISVDGTQEACNQFCGTATAFGTSISLKRRIPGTDHVTEETVQNLIRTDKFLPAYAILSMKEAAKLKSYADLKDKLLQRSFVVAQKLAAKKNFKKAWTTLYPPAKLQAGIAWRTWPSGYHLEILRKLGELGIQAKEGYEASLILNRVLENDPKDIDSYLLRGNAAWQYVTENNTSATTEKAAAEYYWQQYVLRARKKDFKYSLPRNCELCDALARTDVMENRLFDSLIRTTWDLSAMSCEGKDVVQLTPARNVIATFNVHQLEERWKLGTAGEILATSRTWLKDHKDESKPVEMHLRLSKLERLDVIERQDSSEAPVKAVTIDFNGEEMKLLYSEKSSEEFCKNGRWKKTFKKAQ